MTDMGQCDDRYTDRRTALYCGYTVHTDETRSRMATFFACCGDYPAMVDTQIVVDL